MSLRQAAVNLRKGLRFSFQSVAAAAAPAAVSFSNTASASVTRVSPFYQLLPRKQNFLSQRGAGKNRHGDATCWVFFSGQAAIIIGISASPVFAEDVKVVSESSDMTHLRKIEDGSVVSNIHTSKWRVFTDHGRHAFLKGKLDEAERFFLSALQEAKVGFGQRDPHVASSCNNLAELYRVKKAFDKAEPLYLDSIDILEESFGLEDIRVGAAHHNLGQFYLVQRKLEQARVCYERALKIKRRVLGDNHSDYADTMYHLGTVLNLQGKVEDSVALIQDSIRILEEGGQGESNLCFKRLGYLAQLYINSSQLAEAKNAQRKIFQIFELSKGWNHLDTVFAAEGLALTLLSLGRLNEAQELLQRCLDVRKTILTEVHIQIAANMLHIARVKILNSKQLKEISISEAIQELELAKDYLHNSAGVAQQILVHLRRQKGKQQSFGVSKENGKDLQTALIVLLQSHKIYAQLEITKLELKELGDQHLSVVAAENALNQCISTYKEFETAILPKSVEIKSEYLSCLKLFTSLVSDTDSMKYSRTVSLQMLKDEIKGVEAEISSHREKSKQKGTD